MAERCIIVSAELFFSLFLHTPVSGCATYFSSFFLHFENILNSFFSFFFRFSFFSFLFRLKQCCTSDGICRLFWHLKSNRSKCIENKNEKDEMNKKTNGYIHLLWLLHIKQYAWTIHKETTELMTTESRGNKLRMRMMAKKLLKYSQMKLKSIVLNVKLSRSEPI